MQTEWEERTSKQAIWNQIHRPFMVWEPGHPFYGSGVWAEPMVNEWRQGDRPATVFAGRVTFTITEEDIERWPPIAGIHPDGTLTIVPQGTHWNTLGQLPATLESMGMD